MRINNGISCVKSQYTLNSKLSTWLNQFTQLDPRKGETPYSSLYNVFICERWPMLFHPYSAWHRGYMCIQPQGMTNLNYSIIKVHTHPHNFFSPSAHPHRAERWGCQNEYIQYIIHDSCRISINSNMCGVNPKCIGVAHQTQHWNSPELNISQVQIYIIIHYHFCACSFLVYWVTLSESKTHIHERL